MAVVCCVVFLEEKRIRIERARAALRDSDDERFNLKVRNIVQVYYRNMSTPIGDIRVSWCDAGLAEVSTGTQIDDPADGADWKHDANLQCVAIDQLEEYFAGDRRQFELPLLQMGTPFQLSVWKALIEIPFGETTSYGALAARLDRPKASRAVGAANGQNPIAIVVPCHRVIGANGSLTGFAGGIDVKRQLLAFEQAEIPGALWR
jgi:methylated-DNA-[protein]-cysteine S-methyltransferase